MTAGMCRRKITFLFTYRKHKARLSDVPPSSKFHLTKQHHLLGISVQRNEPMGGYRLFKPQHSAIGGPLMMQNAFSPVLEVLRVFKGLNSV